MTGPIERNEIYLSKITAQTSNIVIVIFIILQNNFYLKYIILELNPVNKIPDNFLKLASMVYLQRENKFAL